MEELNIVVLVGTNPLPCYVVARQLIASLHKTPSGPPYHLWLVHSGDNPKIRQSGTKGQADRVLSALVEQGIVSAGQAGLVALSDVSSPLTIRREMTARLKSRIGSVRQDSAPVNVDYTGGTKSMSVSLAQVAEELADVASFTFSYLDAHTSTMIFDGLNPGLYRSSFDVPVSGRSPDLRSIFPLHVKTLMKLHGLGEGKSEEFNFPETDRILAGLINASSPCGIDDFLEYVKEKLRKLPGSGGRKSSQPSCAQNLESYLTDNPGLGTDALFIKNDAVRMVMSSPELHPLVTTTPGGSLSLRASYRGQSPVELKHILKYLDGHWLENYVYNVCRELQTTLGPHTDTQKGVDCRPLATKNSDVHSDIDVAFMNGYQLTAISITTSLSRHICKSKGFEVLLRASQMGGEESRSVLLTGLCPDDVAGLREDLKTVTGSLSDHLLVLGRADWPRSILSNRLQDHILA